MSASARVVVAVATYRRQQMLTELLHSLRHQDIDEPFDVVIVDNDPDGGAVARSAELARALGRDLTVLHEPEPGISAARNRALDAADGHELLAFIDDDERADERWLGTLLRRFDEGGVAAVTGPVEYSFCEEPPRWAVAGGFYTDPGFDDGDVVPMAGTNNLLLDLRVLRRLRLRFDPAYGLIGGSDIVLTRALTDAGERIVWAQHAIVRETVPAMRCRRPWLLRRAIRTGNSYALMHLGRAGSRSPIGRATARVTLLTTGLVRVVVGAVRLVVRPQVNRRPSSAAALRTLFRGIGVIGAALDVRVAEYARPKVPGA